MGIDQILGAKVVDHTGKIVNADEKMLCGIRGGGGTLGIIVELTIKIYPLKKVYCSSSSLPLPRFDEAEDLTSVSRS